MKGTGERRIRGEGGERRLKEGKGIGKGEERIKIRRQGKEEEEERRGGEGRVNAKGKRGEERERKG